MYREHYLVITFFTQITVYMLSAIAMVWIGKKILRNFYMRALYGTRNELEQENGLEADELSEYKGIKMVSMPRA